MEDNMLEQAIALGLFEKLSDWDPKQADRNLADAKAIRKGRAVPGGAHPESPVAKEHKAASKRLADYMDSRAASSRSSAAIFKGTARTKALRRTKAFSHGAKRIRKG